MAATKTIKTAVVATSLNNKSIDSKSAIIELYEYRWPDDESGEYYLFQEQLAAFVRDEDYFKVKCGEFTPRVITSAELQYLDGKRGLPEIHSHTMVVKTDDACHVMARRFPLKFKEYLQLVHDRESKRRSLQAEASSRSLKPPNHVKKAMKDAADFNVHFNQERRDERLAYFDMQTQIIHVPRKKQLPEERKDGSATQYPVAVIPGQFQNYYRKYSPAELKCLPLGTVLDCAPLLPPEEMSLKRQQFFNSLARQETGSPSASSSSDSNDDNADLADSNSETDALPLKRLQQQTGHEPEQLSTPAKHTKRVKKNDAFCGICLKGPEKNKKGIPEDLIHCSQCENSGHPSCLNMNQQLVAVMATYKWQCMECKTCTLCNNPHDEDQMMFCDNCDRGYHSYCVGLRGIPIGRWVCENCGKCSSCLARHPGRSTKWHEEFTKPRDGSGVSYLQIHCEVCSSLFRDGNFCPVCLKVYRNEESDLPMVCCDACDRWIHTDCDGIDERRYEELAKDNSAAYRCILCRGEQEERMDFYHKKYRT